MIKSKKQMFIIIGAFILTLMLGTTTYAFFNYTRTGSTNVVKVGRIAFTSNQTNSISLTNVFPIASSDVLTDTDNVDEAVVAITGDTTYNGGIEYVVKAVEVNNILNDKEIPISIAVTVTGLGEEDSNYFTNRNTTSNSMYTVISNNTIEPNGELLVGYIVKGTTGINGNIAIKAYLDKDKIAISDTYPEKSYSKKVGENTYEVNPNPSSEEVANCVNYVTRTYGSSYLYDGESFENFCNGSGTMHGKNLQNHIDSNSLFLSIYLDFNVIIQTGYEQTVYWVDGTNEEWVNGRVLLTTEEWNSLQSTGVSFKIKVEANEGIWVDNPSRLYNTISRKVNTNYVDSYDDIIKTNPSFRTQDTVGANDNKKTVYYYTGSEAKDNSNVLFGGYCWQIVRTTDDGGVKLAYNGKAKKIVTSTTTMSSSDITYTNNSTYPFIYDASTKKWKSNIPSGTRSISSFKFRVNTSGEYTINYMLSSKEDDKFEIVLNNDQLDVHEFNGNSKGTFYLNEISTNYDIEIKFSNSADNNLIKDGLMFEIVRIDSYGNDYFCPKDERGSNVLALSEGASRNITSIYKFGRNYSYDETTNKFTILDTNDLPTEWNDNTYQSLIGTYFCEDNLTSCEHLSYIVSYESSTNATITSYYMLYMAEKAIIGLSVYNYIDSSISYVGYMSNEYYKVHRGVLSGDYHENASWNGTKYILSSSDSPTSTPNYKHNYVCANAECTEVGYYTYNGNPSTSAYFIFKNGDTIATVLKKIINYKLNDDEEDELLNVHNSSIKSFIDEWYKNNLLSYANYLNENTIYCNDRSVSNLGIWDSENKTQWAPIKFRQYSSDKDLYCKNITDRFSVTNQSARLTYPIALLTAPELNLMGAKYGILKDSYWTMTPSAGTINSTVLGRDSSPYESSKIFERPVDYGFGVRPAITLKPNVITTSGSGTESDPYVVGL